jgi:excisionase family DNA binding protein
MSYWDSPVLSGEVLGTSLGDSMGAMNSQNVTASADVLSPLLSINEVATLLGISRKTLYALIRRGELVPIRVGERARFEPADVRLYLERNRERSQ